jgi:uncharacterized protein (TIGR02678 family)
VTAAIEVSALERAAYQKAARTILNSPLITEIYPNTEALPLVRRWAAPLRAELADLFDYRLELTPTTARLVRTRDTLDASQPATAGAAADRPFDRRRYAYLALSLAVLGRSGTQIALSELAERVAAEAERIDGLELNPEKAADRGAFVDAAAWLEARGAIRLADGNARRWVDDPSAGEALYDVDRDVLRALYRPSRVLQHISSVSALLERPEGVSRDTRRREAAQRVRRALVEQPVVYYRALEPADRTMLRSGAGVDLDVAQLTGMAVERRAEGVALLDVSGMFSDRRFPGGGTVAQVALLLANRIADRVLDPDALPLAQLSAPEPGSARLVLALDQSMPRTDLMVELDQGAPEPAPADTDSTANTDGAEQDAEIASGATSYPLVEDGWLRGTITELLDSYGATFGAVWVADPDRLLAAAVQVLTDLTMVARVPGGLLALPLLARYRNAVVSIRQRPSAAGLFDL